MIKVNVGEWKSAWHEPPTEDGHYVIATFSKNTGCLYSCMDMNYTVEYGWNTNLHNHEHGVSYENRPDTIWTTLNCEVENDTDREDTGI